MARRYAPILVSIWEDDDFQKLSEGAQRCYLMLLSQRKLSMVGVLPYTPRSWSRGCRYTTTETIEAELEELRAARFVIIDHGTDELLIRTVVKHDPPRGPKSVTAMWRALDAVDSVPLRREIVRYAPPSALRGEEVAVPAFVTALMSDAPSHTPSDGGSWSDEHMNGHEPASHLRNAPLEAPSDTPSHGGPHGARAHARAATEPPATEPPSSAMVSPSTSLRGAPADIREVLSGTFKRIDDIA